jgi:hypothetical protein
MVAMVQDLLQPLHRDYAGVRPTMADLAKAVKHLHGAPGPDQWTSSELRALPLSLRKDGKHTAKRLKVFRTVSRLICVRQTSQSAILLALHIGFQWRYPHHLVLDQGISRRERAAVTSSCMLL